MTARNRKIVMVVDDDRHTLEIGGDRPRHKNNFHVWIYETGITRAERHQGGKRLSPEAFFRKDPDESR
ncbi:MAG: hypothetical protein LC633_04315 [Desulfobulbaceae bacterium]|nr:hypothetical protein [Desulfobulbaceae bacterium]